MGLGSAVPFASASFGASRPAPSAAPGDGSIAFDDGVGEVSGTWVAGRAPVVSPGLLIYIMVGSVAATIEALIANGGELVQPIGADAPEITARFSGSGWQRPRDATHD